jgi:hypothetical protein
MAIDAGKNYIYTYGDPVNIFSLSFGFLKRWSAKMYFWQHYFKLEKK